VILDQIVRHPVYAATAACYLTMETAKNEAIRNQGKKSHKNIAANV